MARAEEEGRALEREVAHEVARSAVGGAARPRRSAPRSCGRPVALPRPVARARDRLAPRMACGLVSREGLPQRCGIIRMYRYQHAP